MVKLRPRDCSLSRTPLFWRHAPEQNRMLEIAARSWYTHIIDNDCHVSCVETVNNRSTLLAMFNAHAHVLWKLSGHADATGDCYARSTVNRL